MVCPVPAQLVVNGRFLTRPLSGVDRVAHELLRALTRRQAEYGLDPFATIRVVAPARGVVSPDLPAALQPTPTGRLRGTAWEQLELPRGLGNAWLYSPCNVGPVTRRKQIVTIHDAQVYLAPRAYSRPFRTWYQWLLPRLARRARLVTTVSAYSKRTLEAFGVLPPDKAVVIHNGADHILRVSADPSILARHGLEAGGYFLAIGSLSPHKNLRTVIAAAGTRRNRAFPLVIAGGGNSRVFAEAGLRPTEDTRFLGRVTDAELRALFDQATALVFPSLFEGFGLPPLEAMACGCPVIASDIPTLREVCGDAVLYADPNDAVVWSAHMDRLAEDPAIRGALSEGGRQQAERFTWDRAASGYPMQ